MNRDEILARIASEAQTYYLSAESALDAYADVLTQLAGTLGGDDLDALIAIGTVLIRYSAPGAFGRAGEPQFGRLHRWSQ